MGVQNVLKSSIQQQFNKFWNPTMYQALFLALDWKKKKSN